METTQFRSLPEYAAFRHLYAARLSERCQVERLLAFDNARNSKWFLHGYCEVCRKAVKFLMDWKYAGEHDGLKVPNFRERLLCVGCGLNNRQRFMANLLRTYAVSPAASCDIYLYEQVTDFYRFVASTFSHAKVVGSEYLGISFRPGELVKNIRHEDALALSFPEETFDLIASNDVYEHVPDVERALKEAYRVLKPTGQLVFSIPFHLHEAAGSPRSIIENGKLVHLKPCQYHGNPVSRDGSLVFHDFGWDILDQCKTAGFRDAYMLSYYSMLHGYIGGGMQYVFVAKK